MGVLRLFGTLCVDHDGVAGDLGPPKQRSVLAILALDARRVVPTNALIDALWGETPPRTATHSIQIYVSELRRALAAIPGVAIQTSRPGYRLDAPRGWVDVTEFERLVESGTQLEDLDNLESAMALWSAEPLQEFRHEAWARSHIDRLNGRRAEAACHLAAARLDDAPDSALRWADIALEAKPYGERGCELVMLSRYRLGHHAEALRTYTEFRQRLDEDLGLVPTPALARRNEQILLHDAALDAPPLVGLGGAGARRRRRWIAAGAALGALGLTSGIAIAVADDGTAPPGRALLLVNDAVSQIRLQAEAGYEDGLQRTNLAGTTVEVEDLDAVETALAGGVDLVVAPAVAFDLGRLAAAHPAAHFVAFDQVVKGPNVTSVIINSHESSYLAGVVAALTSRTGTVGFIGGVDEELIWEFEAGFTAGVETTDPNAIVLTEYLSAPPEFGGGYENAPAGEAAARRMYTAGADVVFAAAGTSGLGVFEAAVDVTAETGLYRWAIGVDTDQFETISDLPLTVQRGRWEPHILTSVLKHTDAVIRDAIIKFDDGDLAPGTRLVSLADGAGGLSYNGGFLDAHHDELARIQERIIAGEINVPCRPVDRRDQATQDRAHPCQQ